MKERLSQIIFSIIMLIFWLANCPSAVAQDIQYSQYSRTPIQLNPALTGHSMGKTRVLTAYRNQWSQFLRGDAYVSGFVSGDFNFQKDSLQGFGIGVSLERDVAGELSFGDTAVKLSAAYQRKVAGTNGNDHRIFAGLGVGIVQRRIDLTNARWPSQHDGNGGFDPTIIIELPADFNSDFLFVDLNMGLMWQSTFKNGNRFFIGAAGHHINKPNVSFFNGGIESDLTIRYALHGGGEIHLGNKLTHNWSVLPSFLYLAQGESNVLNLGGSVRKYLGSEVTHRFIEFGVLARLGRNLSNAREVTAFVPSLILNLKRFSVGLSVDVPTNELRQVSGFNGAFEVSLGYLFGALSDSSVRSVW